MTENNLIPQNDTHQLGKLANVLFSERRLFSVLLQNFKVIRLKDGDTSTELTFSKFKNPFG